MALSTEQINVLILRSNAKTREERDEARIQYKIHFPEKKD